MAWLDDSAQRHSFARRIYLMAQRTVSASAAFPSPKLEFVMLRSPHTNVTAFRIFQGHCRTADEHVIADLICDLGHLAEERGLDFLSEVKRGIGHWYAEHHAGDGELLGPDAAVEIIIRPK
jgi:hypothetical protein